MNYHLLPNPSRCREIPPQFSWIDHRLVRLHYFERCSTDALALYLFLITVADARGLSYYGHASLIKQLKFSTTRFMQARTLLINEELISYQHPLYQVLSLDTEKKKTHYGRNVQIPHQLGTIKQLVGENQGSQSADEVKK